MMILDLFSISYTSQLSCLSCESQACGLKTSISRLQANFSCLIEKCELCLAWHNFQKYVYSDPCKERKPCVKWITIMTITSSRSLICEVKSTGSELAFIRVLGLWLWLLSSFYTNHVHIADLHFLWEARLPNRLGLSFLRFHMFRGLDNGGCFMD